MAGRPGSDTGGVMVAYPCGHQCAGRRLLRLRVDDVSAPPARGHADGSRSRGPGMRNDRPMCTAEPAPRRQGNSSGHGWVVRSCPGRSGAACPEREPARFPLSARAEARLRSPDRPAATLPGASHPEASRCIARQQLRAIPAVVARDSLACAS